jgi:5-methylthioribose kinase
VNQKFIDLLADTSLIHDVLTRLNLIEPDERIKTEPLTGGVSSTILRIEARNGTWCLKQALPLLKVNKIWSAPVDRVYAEIAWLELAKTIAPGCSPEILGVDRLTNSFVMTYLPPGSFANWKTELMAGRINRQFAASVGSTLARIHSRTAQNEEIRRNFSNDENFLALRLDPYLLEIARQYPALSSSIQLRAEQMQSLKLALVHGDMSPKNILVGASGPVFLDAECACYGDPAFDAAFCLNHLLLKSLAIQDCSGLLLQAFEEFAESYLTGATWEAREELERRITSLLPMLLLARISGKSPVEYLNGLQKEAIFAAAAPLICQGTDSLCELEHIWKMEVLRHE